MASPRKSPASSSTSSKSPAKRVHFEFDDDGDDAMAVDSVPLFPTSPVAESSTPTHRRQTSASSFTAPTSPATLAPPAFPVFGNNWTLPSPPTGDHSPNMHRNAQEFLPINLLMKGLGSERSHLYYDVRFPPTSACVTKRNMYLPLDVNFRNSYATQPHLPRIRLISKDLAWTIVVENPKGVTLEALLHAIHQSLDKSIGEGEFFLAAPETQRKLIHNCKENCTGEIAKATNRSSNQGIKRVDLLGHRTVIASIERPDPSNALLNERVLNQQHKNETWILDFQEARTFRS